MNKESITFTKTRGQIKVASHWALTFPRLLIIYHCEILATCTFFDILAFPALNVTNYIIIEIDKTATKSTKNLPWH
jgi:hypothetical protein